MPVKIIIITILSLAILYNLTPNNTQASETCRWTYSSKNDTDICQRSFGADGKKWEKSEKCTNANKGQYDNICCCQKTILPKYIVIGSLVIFFGLATTYFLVIKKNEDN